MRIDSSNAAKSAAKSIRKRLNKDGVEISHALALETVSTILGYKNWNVASASFEDDVNNSPFLGIQDYTDNPAYLNVIYTGGEMDRQPFQHKWSDKTPIEVVAYDQPTPQLAIEPAKFFSNQYQQTFPVNGIADAEMKIFDIVREYGGEPVQVDPTKADEIGTAVIIMVRRLANIIAACSRRGAGNICIVPTWFVEYFEKASISSYVQCDAPEITNSRYNYVGDINGGMRVFATDVVDDIFVCWKLGSSEYDSPAFYLENAVQGQPILINPYPNYVTDRMRCIRLDRGNEVILDQNKVDGDFTYIGEVHRKLIDPLLFEKVDEISPTGLTVVSSAGYPIEDIAKVLNQNLSKYDFLVDGVRYKLKNVSFI